MATTFLPYEQEMSSPLLSLLPSHGFGGSGNSACSMVFHILSPGFPQYHPSTKLRLLQGLQYTNTGSNSLGARLTPSPLSSTRRPCTSASPSHTPSTGPVAPRLGKWRKGQLRQGFCQVVPGWRLCPLIGFHGTRGDCVPCLCVGARITPTGVQWSISSSPVHPFPVSDRISTSST